MYIIIESFPYNNSMNILNICWPFEVLLNCSLIMNNFYVFLKAIRSFFTKDCYIGDGLSSDRERETPNTNRLKR